MMSFQMPLQANVLKSTDTLSYLDSVPEKQNKTTNIALKHKLSIKQG